MPVPEADRILAAKLHSRAWRRAPRRSLTPADEAVAGTVLAHVAAWRASPFALEAGGAAGSSENGLEESCHQASRLLIKAESNQKLLQLRRGEGPEQASYEILAPVESPNPTSDADSAAPAASPDGVSAFIARVLDQLALSAWLPAAFLTASVAILLQFRSAKSANMLEAVQALTAHPVQVLVIMIPLLVIATVVTQAFSFESIRALEGYWGGSRPANLARRLMTWRHVRRQKSTIDRLRRESEKAVHAAMPEMLMSGIPFPVVKAIEARVSGGQSPSDLTGEQMELSKTMDWRPWCAAWRLARVNHLVNEAKRYPDPHRVLPTKLGNLMRATEDELQHAGGDVQSFMHRQRDKVSPRVRMQHDQFRTRLEMYCTLVLVSGFLLALIPIVLAGHIGVAAVTITFASFAAMAVVSYLAAIASAGGYCSVLKQMDKES
jgi:FtsH-binding integral membrane protein